MKPLKNHTLLYDRDCPLCALYTDAFIKAGLLDENGRTAYEEGITLYAGKLDETIACNEIALINTRSGNVTYGVESLLLILASRFPSLKTLTQQKVLVLVLKKIYAFISFNRKVIATSANYTAQTCVPEFKLFYRLLYIIVSAVFTSTILLHYSRLLYPLLPPSNMTREYLICFGQLIFQSAILLCIRSKKTMLFDYLGNMMTVSLLGALLLIPALLVNHWLVLSPFLFLGYFFAVVMCMFLHHMRRVKNIKAPFWLSYTWVAYRCLVLLLIL